MPDRGVQDIVDGVKGLAMSNPVARIASAMDGAGGAIQGLVGRAKAAMPQMGKPAPKRYTKDIELPAGARWRKPMAGGRAAGGKR